MEIVGYLYELSRLRERSGNNQHDDGHDRTICNQAGVVTNTIRMPFACLPEPPRPLGGRVGPVFVGL